MQINRSGLRAICVGTNGIDELRLTFVPTNADVKVGDLVVTSGLGHRFPAGYPIGEVAMVEIDHGEPFARIFVKPSAQVSRVHEVLLVWPERQADDSARLGAVEQEPAQ